MTLEFEVNDDMEKVLLLCLFLMILLTGCSRQSTTSAKIELTTASFESDLGAEAEGGVYLYGYGPGGKSFGQVMNGTSFNETLPNGSWSFYVVAWDGANIQYGLSGITRCAQATVNLDGTEVSLGLSLTKDNCKSSAFTNNVSMNSLDINYDAINDDVFPALEFEVCNDFPENNGLNTSSDPDTACDHDLSNSASKRNRGYFTSFKITVPSFKKLNGTMEETGSESDLQSVCIPIDSSNARGISDPLMTSYLNIPMGSNASPLPIKIRGYYDDYCDDTRITGSKSFTMMKGRLENAGEVRAHVANDPIENVWKGKQYLLTPDAEVCQGTRLLTNSSPALPQFSGGTGVPFQPYLICTKDQFNSIANDTTLLISSFKLMQDLDFSFDTLTPVGSNLDESPSSSLSYLGNFDGNNHSLSHFFLAANEASYVGVFRKVGELSTPSYIKNLKIHNAGIFLNCSGSCEFLGILAGNSIDSSISNIHVNGGVSINAIGASITNCGGMIGSTFSENTDSATWPAYQRLTAEIDIHVRGESNSTVNAVGGIIGDLQNATLSQSAALVRIDGRDTQNVGGVVGVAEPNTLLKELHSQGEITARNNVGGIVGVLNDDGMLSDSYSYASVSGKAEDELQAAITGGLIGSSNPNSTIARNFYAVGLVESSMSIPGATRYLVGDANLPVTCTNSFARQPPGMSSFIVGAGCLDKSSVQLKTLSNYAYGSSNMVEVGTLSDSDKKFYVASADADASSFYDYPRLKWELEVENEVSFLQRPCSGNLAPTASMGGSGNSATDPYRVCRPDQLHGANTDWDNSNKYYKLMRDIDFEFEFPAGSLGDNGVLGANFNGNGKTLINVNISASAFSMAGNDYFLPGIWKSIASGAKLTDLKLHHVEQVYTSGGAINDSGTYYAGLLAATNAGEVDKIEIENSKIDLTHLEFSEMKGVDPVDVSVNLGGLVGYNSGKMSRIMGNPHLEFFNPSACSTTPCSTNNLHHWDETTVGGLAGINQGLIEKTRAHLHFQFHDANPQAALQMTSDDNLSMGGIAGKNIPIYNQGGEIKTSHADFLIDLQSDDLQSNSNGVFSFGGITGSNQGIVENSMASTSFNITLEGVGFAFEGITSLGGLIGLNDSPASSIRKSLAWISPSELIPSPQDYSDMKLGGISGVNNGEGAILSNSNACLAEIPHDFAAGGNFQDSDHQCLLLSSISISSGVINLQDSTNNLSLTLSDWSFTQNPMDFNNPAIWYIKPDDLQIYLRDNWD